VNRISARSLSFSPGDQGAWYPPEGPGTLTVSGPFYVYHPGTLIDFYEETFDKPQLKRYIGLGRVRLHSH